MRAVPTKKPDAPLPLPSTVAAIAAANGGHQDPEHHMSHKSRCVYGLAFDKRVRNVGQGLRKEVISGVCDA